MALGLPSRKRNADPNQGTARDDRHATDPVSIAAAELRLSRDLEHLRKEIGDLQVVAGKATLTAALEQDDVDLSTTQRIGEMQARVAALESAIDEARALRLAAIPSTWQPEIDQRRARAAELRAEAADVKARAHALLDQLEELEACRWVAWTPSMSAPPPGIYADPDPTARWPKSSRLDEQAADLEREARGIEMRSVQVSGEVTGTSAEALVAAVFAEPLKMGPAYAAIVEWATEAEQRERTRRQHIPTTSVDHVAPDAPLEFRLVWDNMRIDRARSYVSRPATIQDGDYPDQRQMITVGPESSANERMPAGRGVAIW